MDSQQEAIFRISLSSTSILSLPPSLSSLHSLEGRPLPTECAIKVFKTTLNEFKNRDRYIKDDYRFKARFGKQNPRKVVRMWAEKEMHNLKRLAMRRCFSIRQQKSILSLPLSLLQAS